MVRTVGRPPNRWQRPTAVALPAPATITCCNILGAAGGPQVTSGHGPPKTGVGAAGMIPSGDSERRMSSASTRRRSSCAAADPSVWTWRSSTCRSRRRSDTGMAGQRRKDLKILPEGVRPSIVSSWELSASEAMVVALFECRSGCLLNHEYEKDTHTNPAITSHRRVLARMVACPRVSRGA